RDLRRRFHPFGRLSHAHASVLRDRRSHRDGAGPLGAHQSGLLVADEDPVDPARRAFRPGTWRTQPVRLLLQLQRDGRRLAARSDRYRGRMAARYADRRPRPELSRAIDWLAFRIPARPGVAGGSPSGDDVVQVAAAPMGEGLDSNVPEAAAADPAVRSTAGGEGRGVLSSLG